MMGSRRRGWRRRAAPCGEGDAYSDLDNVHGISVLEFGGCIYFAGARLGYIPKVTFMISGFISTTYMMSLISSFFSFYLVPFITNLLFE
jgi:hypothetical protein